MYKEVKRGHVVMCLIVVGVNSHPQYPLIVCGNRDEFFNRKAKKAHFWPDAPILAGRDEEHGGSWLGVSTEGAFAAVTNVRNPDEIRTEDHQSRGNIVTNFLQTNSDTKSYIAQIRASAKPYLGYNALVGNKDELIYFSNEFDDTIPLTKGIYALSNANLKTNWPKTERAKQKFQKIVQSQSTERTMIAMFLSLLQDKTTFKDELLPNTGVGLQLERQLSSIFILGEEYGTRASTVVLFRRDGKVLFKEKSFGPNGRPLDDVEKNFYVKSRT